MCLGLLFPAAPRYKMIASLFLDHGVSPNLPDRRGLPLILHSGTATTRQLLLDAGACVPAWFDAEDSAAACQDDENCGEVPGMSGLGEAVFDPKEEHCDARLGTLVNGVRDFAFSPCANLSSFRLQTAWLKLLRWAGGCRRHGTSRGRRWPSCALAAAAAGARPQPVSRPGATEAHGSAHHPFFCCATCSSECPLGILTTLGP